MKPLPTRKKFASLADEAEYLYDKAGFWMYERHQYYRARPFVRRLNAIMASWDNDRNLIPHAEVMALIADFNGDLDAKIKHTKTKISLLNTLLFGAPEVDAYDWADLLDEMELLAIFLEESNQRAKALDMVDDCKVFARKHKLKFDEGSLRKTIWDAEP